jgi:hypothetical protein
VDILTAVVKLARAARQAGFTVEQIIQLLETGTGSETLLLMIEGGPPAAAVSLTSSRWIM